MDINNIIKTQVLEYLVKNELIEEGVSDIAYHFTTRESLFNILKYNQFKLSPAIVPSEKDHSRGKLYFMSTTRSRSSGSFTNRSIKIVLDAKKMSAQN